MLKQTLKRLRNLLRLGEPSTDSKTTNEVTVSGDGYARMNFPAAAAHWGDVKYVFYPNGDVYQYDKIENKYTLIEADRDPFFKILLKNKSIRNGESLTITFYKETNKDVSNE